MIHSYPVGAAMFLEYGNDSVHFRHKPIEGSPASPSTEPSVLILDGQQRLTSLYNALYSKKSVHTKTDKGKPIDRFYYINIEKALDPCADDEEIVVSVPAPEKKIVTFKREVTLDLSTRELEFKNKMFPLNIILDPSEEVDWQMDYNTYYVLDKDIYNQFKQFFTKVINPV